MRRGCELLGQGEFLIIDGGLSKGDPTTSRRRYFEGLAPYYAPTPLRGGIRRAGALKGWSKVRRCERPGEVVGWADVAIRAFLVGYGSSWSLGAKFADF